MFSVFKNWKANNAKRKDFNGEKLTIPKSKWGYLRKFKLYGKSIQYGEPSPDNPVEIKTLGESEDIVSCGENLFDYKQNWWGFGSTGLTTYQRANKIDGDDLLIYGNVYYSYSPGIAVSVKKNTTYTFSFRIKEYFEPGVGGSSAGGKVWVKPTADAEYYSKLLANVFFNDNGEYSVEFNSGENTKVLLTIQVHEGLILKPHNYGCKADKIQLIEGKQSEYIEYQGSTTPITLRDTEGKLHTPKSLPDGTRDEVDLDGGECVNRVFKTTIPVGHSWSNSTGVAIRATANTNKMFRVNVGILDAYMPNKEGQTEANFYCDKARVGGSVGWAMGGGKVSGLYGSNRLLIFYGVPFSILGITELTAENHATVRAAALNYVKSFEWTFVYERGEPITWQLHPDEQKKIITVDSDTAYVYTNAEVQPEISANAISYGED